MKAALVACSFGINATLLGLLAVRPEIAPAPLGDFLRRTFAVAPATETTPPVPRKPKPRAKLWAQVYHDDPAMFIVRLRAAGFPANAIRELVALELGVRYDERIRALENPDPNTPFWLMKPPAWAVGNGTFEAIGQLRRDRARAMRGLFTYAFFNGDDEITEDQRRQFGNLSRTKTDALQRIEDDYAEMNSMIRAAAGGIVLPQDREKLDLLLREKAADLAAMLTPEELADYTLRSSPITRMLRTRWGEFDPTEEEFLAVYQAQKNLNDRLGSNTFSEIEQRARDEAQAAYLWELHAAFGQERYSEFVWKTSAEYQQLSRIAERNNLPADTPQQLFGIREAIARESNRIYDDRTADVEAKRAALKQLAQVGRTQITTALGPNAAPSYMKIADRWLGYIEGGAAVAFTKPETVTVATEHNTWSYTGLPNIRWLPRPGR